MHQVLRRSVWIFHVSVTLLCNFNGPEKLFFFSFRVLNSQNTYCMLFFQNFDCCIFKVIGKYVTLGTRGFKMCNTSRSWLWPKYCMANLHNYKKQTQYQACDELQPQRHISRARERGYVCSSTVWHGAQTGDLFTSRHGMKDATCCCMNSG